MEKKSIVTKILSILGTLLVWSPLLLAAFFSLTRLIRTHLFHFDFLMPFELFPLIFVGGGLLLWAALRARMHLKWIAWGSGVAFALFFITQGLAVLTGLDSMAGEPSGWRFAIVLAAVGIFILAEIALGIGGALMIRDLFSISRSLKKKA